MSKKSPGATARALGAQLRDCRESRGLTLREVADIMEWDKSALSRVENGSRRPSVEDLALLLGTYRVAGRLRNELLAMARGSDEPDWWWHGDSGLPRSVTALVSYESEAARVVDWAPMLIPGLLQTRDYARAWMLADRVDVSGVNARLTARMKRQRMLDHGFSYRAYLGEAALRTSVGDPAILAAQLAKLRSMSTRPNVSIRLVPIGLYPQRAQLGGFHALEFSAASPMVLVELIRTSVFMNEADQTDPYLELADELAAVALTESETTDLITRAQIRLPRLAQSQ